MLLVGSTALLTRRHNLPAPKIIFSNTPQPTAYLIQRLAIIPQPLSERVGNVDLDSTRLASRRQPPQHPPRKSLRQIPKPLVPRIHPPPLSPHPYYPRQTINLSLLRPTNVLGDQSAHSNLSSWPSPSQLMLTTLISKLPHSRQRKSITCFMIAITAYYALFPCAAPLLARSSLAATPTTIDKDGICLQTHPYTCGPAAAVTCLRILNIPATEGDLAIRAYTAPCVGTDGRSLANAINQLCEPAHLHCNYQWFNSPDTLPARPPSPPSSPRAYGGHYIMILEVTPDFITVGYHLTGRDKLTRAEFLSEWTGAIHTSSPKSHRGDPSIFPAHSPFNASSWQHSQYRCSPGISSGTLPSSSSSSKFEDTCCANPAVLPFPDFAPVDPGVPSPPGTDSDHAAFIASHSSFVTVTSDAIDPLYAPTIPSRRI